MKKIATVVDKLYFDLAFEIDWRSDMEELFKQAQELHKQQLEDAYLSGSADRQNDEGSFEEYYTETYGPDEDADFEIED
jgi:hypothetical protein